MANAGAPSALKAELKLKEPSNYEYVGGAKVVAAKGQDKPDAQMFEATEVAMRAVGFADNQIHWVRQPGLKASVESGGG